MITRNKIEKWLEAKSQLDYWKAEEMKLRREIADELLDGQPTGTHNFTKLGYKIKAVKKVNYNLDEQALAAIWDSMTAAEKEAIKYKPSLSLAIYKKLDHHEMLDQVIVTKPATPTLSIEEIKDE